MRILIVDDDDARRQGLLSHLLICGIVARKDVVLVDCLNDARQQLKSSYFDVLIMDVVVPQRKDTLASPEHGLSLLNTLSRSNLYKRPERVIGITAYVEDLSAFRVSFEQHCVALIEAKREDGAWKGSIADALTYTGQSLRARETSGGLPALLTVHGIRTFGGWQRRLHSVLNRRFGRIDSHSYKYGYFSSIALLFPPARVLEVHRLRRKLKSLFQRHPDERFVIFAHSFGTYLVAEALKSILKQRIPVPVSTLVFCGSVLPESYSLSTLQSANIRIVNDCADGDLALYASKALVYGLGMAGKVGFFGFNNQDAKNRFFLGGHSSYFEGDEFMEQYWAPLLDEAGEVVDMDLRSHSFWKHAFADKIVGFLGTAKPWLYWLGIAWVTREVWRIGVGGG